LIDRAVLHLLAHSQQPHNVCEFSPYGYDERQYCSPGFNLPVGCLQRTPHGKFPQYHTSADNVEFVAPEALADTLNLAMDVVQLLETNLTYRNLYPKGEPQLGKRGLYRSIGGRADTETRELAMLWVLNLSDGQHSLLDIAERSGLKYEVVQRAAMDLQQHHLLSRQTEEKRP
jgi:aminopeptidase-like protein